jgi:hypothetical protein
MNAQKKEGLGVLSCVQRSWLSEEADGEVGKGDALLG